LEKIKNLQKEIEENEKNFQLETSNLKEIFQKELHEKDEKIEQLEKSLKNLRSENYAKIEALTIVLKNSLSPNGPINNTTTETKNLYNDFLKMEISNCSNTSTPQSKKRKADDTPPPIEEAVTELRRLKVRFM
jgi:hypothetical protein